MRCNHNHLYYFYMVAKLHSVTKAAVELKLAQSTVSAQIRSLEETFGEKLFEKEGRHLKLTETGQIAMRYAHQIFELSSEMVDLIEGTVTGKAETVRIGIADTIPKLFAYRLLDPLYDSPSPPRLEIREGSAEKLLAELAIHLVDAVVLDCPIPPSINVRAYNHPLGQCGVSFLLSKRSPVTLKRGFPRCLEETEVLLPGASSIVRGELDTWFRRNGLSVRVAGEFQDSALLKLFGRNGRGIFPVPSFIEKEVCREMDCRVVGRITERIERYYLITTQRRLSNPNLARLTAHIR